MKTKLLLLITILTTTACNRVMNEKNLEPINVVFNQNSTQQVFGVARLSQTLEGIGYSPILADKAEANGKEKISVSILPSDDKIQKKGSPFLMQTVE